MAWSTRAHDKKDTHKKKSFLRRNTDILIKDFLSILQIANFGYNYM